MTTPKFQPRIGVVYFVDGKKDFGPYGIAPSEDFMSVKESDALVREAVAKAYEECEETIKTSMRWNSGLQETLHFIEAAKAREGKA